MLVPAQNFPNNFPHNSQHLQASPKPPKTLPKISQNIFQKDSKRYVILVVPVCFCCFSSLFVRFLQGKDFPQISFKYFSNPPTAFPCRFSLEFDPCYKAPFRILSSCDYAYPPLEIGRIFGQKYRVHFYWMKEIHCFRKSKRKH